MNDLRPKKTNPSQSETYFHREKTGKYRKLLIINKNKNGIILASPAALIQNREKGRMHLQKILVLVGISARDLRGVHYSLSLAERITTKVFILQQSEGEEERGQYSVWLEEALHDLINSARQAGLNVTHLIATGDITREIISLVKSEGITLLVLGVDNGECESIMLQLKPHLPCQIVQVKEKDHISYL
jgi:K+-sensing histidine kinase KdpD